MQITRKRVALAISVAGLASAVGLTGCSNQLNDLKGVPQQHPDYTMTYLNVSGFPNVTMLCINGAGFATTTRTYDSLTPIPEWDAFCKAKEKPGS